MPVHVGAPPSEEHVFPQSAQFSPWATPSRHSMRRSPFLPIVSPVAPQATKSPASAQVTIPPGKTQPLTSSQLFTRQRQSQSWRALPLTRWLGFAAQSYASNASKRQEPYAFRPIGVSHAASQAQACRACTRATADGHTQKSVSSASGAGVTDPSFASEPQSV